MPHCEFLGRIGPTNDLIASRLVGRLAPVAPQDALVQPRARGVQTDGPSIRVGKIKLVLDLGGLQFMDSTGLRIILWARDRCQESGREFALTPGSQQVQRLLSVSGAGEHLRIIASPGDLLV